MKLEKGMNIYCGIQKYKIDRLTAKQAVVNISDYSDMRFDIEQIDPFHIYAKGQSGYGVRSFSIETPEILKRIERYKLVLKFNEIKSEKLSSKQLERIIDITKEV